jgi:hypothetical protein
MTPRNLSLSMMQDIHALTGNKSKSRKKEKKKGSMVMCMDLEFMGQDVFSLMPYWL